VTERTVSPTETTKLRLTGAHQVPDEQLPMPPDLARRLGRILAEAIVADLRQDHRLAGSEGVQPDGRQRAGDDRIIPLVPTLRRKRRPR
jgi:hypothetical protein